MCVDSGRVFGCLPISRMIVIIGGVTGLIEFIFYVLWWICQEPGYKLTLKFVNNTYNANMHYLLIAANFLLLATLCVRMASFFVPYALCTIAVALWSLSSDVGIIKQLVEYSKVNKAPMDSKELAVRILAFLWNLFIAALYLTFGSFAILCAKQMSSSETVANPEQKRRTK